MEPLNLVHRSFRNAPIQAFREIVGPLPERCVGGPVLTQPSEARLRFWFYGRVADTFVSSAEPSGYLRGTYNYVGPVFSHFGHVVSEMVHRILPSRTLFQHDRWLAVTGVGQPTDYDALPITYRNVLQFLGVDRSNLTVINQDTTVEVLNIAQQGATVGLTPSKAYLELLRTYSDERLQELCTDREPIEKLYVSRSQQQSGNILGESYLESCLAEEGFLVLYPEKHTIVEQLNFYRRAQTSVFVEGSACHGTELLGVGSLAKVLLVLRRQGAGHLNLYRPVLSPRARSFGWFDKAVFLGSAIVDPGGRPLTNVGVSIVEPRELSAFFREQGVATLAACNRDQFFDVAERDLHRYIGSHSSAGAMMAAPEKLQELFAGVLKMRDAPVEKKPSPAPPDPDVGVDDLTGAQYIQMLRWMHVALEPRTYLEIGSATGDSAEQATCHTILIDPDPRKLKIVMNGKPSLMAFQLESDKFFERYGKSDLLGMPVDLAFLDGLHYIENLLRDFLNVEQLCLPGSVIAMHDCIPVDVEIARRVNDPKLRTLRPGWWAGDVWKIIPILKFNRPDLRIIAVDSAPTGLVIVTDLSPGSTILRDRHDQICAEWKDVDLAEYGLQRFLRECNLMPADEFASNLLPGLARKGATIHTTASAVPRAMEAPQASSARTVPSDLPAGAAVETKPTEAAVGTFPFGRPAKEADPPKLADAAAQGIICLYREERFELADTMAEMAVQLFPGNQAVWLQYAMVAMHRPDPNAAAARFERVRARFPKSPPAYCFGAMALRQAGRIDEAEVILERAMVEFQQFDPMPFIEYAQCATARGQKDEAVWRWEKVRELYPDQPQGYWMLSSELMRAGRLEEAEAVIEEGIGRMPGERFMLWQWGRTATQRHDWAEAKRRWEVAKAQHPDWRQIDDGIAEMRLAMGLQGVDEAATAASAAADVIAPVSGSALRDLLQRFESLGDNCEFGIVQRAAGIEPLGLLRWANISPDKLIATLNARFEGVGEAANTRLQVTGEGEYELLDTRYFGMHTFVNAGRVSSGEMMPKMLRRLQFLKEKLIDDLTSGKKIFLYKSIYAPLSPEKMRAMANAIRRYGNGTLFCVQKPPTPEKGNRVERIEDALIAGYLSTLTRSPQAGRDHFADWVELCQAAAELCGPPDRRMAVTDKPEP